MITMLLKEMYGIKRKKCCFDFLYHDRLYLSNTLCGEEPDICKPLEPPTALRVFRLFQPFRMENAFFVDAFVRVGAEVVALRLD